MHRLLSTIIAIAAVTLAACGPAPTEQPPPAAAETGPARGPLEGVWRVTGVTIMGGPNEGTNSSPQPGLYYFGRQYYSIARVNGTEPRELWPDGTTRANAPEALLRSTFVPFTANAGTYELEDDTLTMRPNVALMPNFMGSGSATATIRIEGDTLWLTQATDAEPIVTTERQLERVE